MKLYLVRHGETTGNALKIHQNIETPLLDIGMDQVKFLAHRFKDIPLDLIFSSDAKRTLQTAQILNRVIRKKIIKSTLLRERKMPTQIEGQGIYNLEVAKIKQAMREYANDPTWHHSDEENYFDFKSRASEFIKSVQKRDEDQILAVTHRNLMRMLVFEAVFSQLSTWQLFSAASGFQVKNTGITILEYKNNQWELVVWNDHSHLE